MKDLKKKIVIGLVLALFGFVAISPSFVADSSNVSIKWYIPSDIGISIAYPTALTDVEFRPTSQTFSHQGAESQADGTPAFNITNTGNVDMDLDAVFTSDMPTNVTQFNITQTWAIPWNPQFFWTDANDTTPQTIYSGLAQGLAVEYYCNSTGTNVANTTYPFSRNFQITSSAT
jgi:hypothetical protein